LQKCLVFAFGKLGWLMFAVLLLKAKKDKHKLSRIYLSFTR